MKMKYLPKNTLYAIASILSPIIAGIGTYVYQSLVNSEFWSSLHNVEGASNGVGATMVFAEVIQMTAALTIGCLIGIILAVRSIYIDKAKSKMGIMALTVNGLPFLLLSFFVVKGIIFGI